MRTVEGAARNLSSSEQPNGANWTNWTPDARGWTPGGQEGGQEGGGETGGAEPCRTLTLQDGQGLQDKEKVIKEKEAKRKL